MAGLLLPSSFAGAEALPSGGMGAQVWEYCARLLAPKPEVDFFSTIRGLPKDRKANFKSHYLWSKYFLLIGDIEINVLNETLRFDITVNRPYRGRGLYQKLLAHTLRIFPEVTSIPAEMPFSDSDNATIFLQKLYRTDDLKAAELNMSLDFDKEKTVKTLDREQIMDWRERMIEAYYQMPAAKARERVGFGRLNKLTLAVDVGCIEFDAVKGPRSDSKHVDIFVSMGDKNLVELTSSGKVAQASRRVTNVGADYMRTWEPCHKARLLR